MRASLSLLAVALGGWAGCVGAAAASKEKVCTLRPLGHGRDDTDQVREVQLTYVGISLMIDVFTG